MTPPRIYRRSIVARMFVVFCVAALVLTSLTGSLLAAYPPFGGYAFTRVRPGFNSTTKMEADRVFVRSPDGRIRYMRPTDVSDWPLSDGEVVGRAKYVVITAMTGHPRPSRIAWTLSVSEVEATEHGPPASDVRAWNAIVIEAVSHVHPFPDLGRPPALLREGGTQGVTFRPLVFASNAGYRLLHAPWWIGVSLAAAVIVAFTSCAARIRDSHRPLRNRCWRCGYDRAGIPFDAPCPECGSMQPSSPDVHHVEPRI